MKGIVVTGQYGNGKTTTINKILPGLLKDHSVGIFVAESSNIAPDQTRYVGGNAAGVSFASVCCPTLEDMNTALDTAISGESWDYLLMEPPGNMDPRFVVDSALSRGIDLEHILMLVARDFYETDRLMPTFNSGMDIASSVGITRANKGGIQLSNLETKIREEYSTQSLVLIDEGFSWESLKSLPTWDQTEYGSILGENRTHSDHYKRTMRIIDPNLSETNVLGLLADLAQSGITRAKGSVPKHGLTFDIQRGELETKRSQPWTGSGTLSVFSPTDLPVELIDPFSVNPDSVPEYVREGATVEEMRQVFAKLYDQSRAVKKMSITANDSVLYTFQPVDPAYKIASQIFYRTEGAIDEPLRAILVPRISVRFSALKALESSSQPDRDFIGMMLTTYLAQKLETDKDRHFPELVDQAQLRRIRTEVVPKLFNYASSLSQESLSNVHDYSTREGPYFLEMSRRALPYASKDLVASAQTNMVSLNRSLDNEELAMGWEKLDV